MRNKDQVDKKITMSRNNDTLIFFQCIVHQSGTILLKNVRSFDAAKVPYKIFSAKMAAEDFLKPWIMTSLSGDA